MTNTPEFEKHEAGFSGAMSCWAGAKYAAHLKEQARQFLGGQQSLLEMIEADDPTAPSKCCSKSPTA